MTEAVRPFDDLREQVATALQERSARERPAVARRLLARVAESSAQPPDMPLRSTVRESEPGPLAMLTSLLAASWEDTAADQTPTTFDEVLQHELASLLRELGEDELPARAASAPSRVKELTAVRGFRESWLKRIFDKRVAQAIREGPENPGPLNPDMLLVKSLSAMRALSPHYLYRYLAWLDTLLWLEKAGETLPGSAGGGSASQQAAAKRTAARPRSRSSTPPKRAS